MSWPWNPGQRSLKVIESGTILEIWCGFLLVFYRNSVRKMHRFWDIRLPKCRDLENRVRGPSKSLEISPSYNNNTNICKPHIVSIRAESETSYWRSIVTMALSRVVSKIFNVENVMTMKLVTKVTQGHWKLYHSIDCVWFLLVFFSNFVPKMHRFWDIRLHKCRDLENRVRGPSRSLEMSR